MTGFGRAEIDLPGVRLSVEIATVNQKNLQVSVFGPEAWPALESTASAWIRARLQRGKVTARVTQAAVTATQRQWDAETVANNLDELAKIAARCGVAFAPDSDLLHRLAVGKGPSFGLRYTLAAPFLWLAHFEEVTTEQGRAGIRAAGLDPDLLRISVGLEPIEEIWSAFVAALPK